MCCVRGVFQVFTQKGHCLVTPTAVCAVRAIKDVCFPSALSTLKSRIAPPNSCSHHMLFVVRFLWFLRASSSLRRIFDELPRRPNSSTPHFPIAQGIAASPASTSTGVKAMDATTRRMPGAGAGEAANEGKKRGGRRSNNAKNGKGPASVNSGRLVTCTARSYRVYPGQHI